jgi:hypothetical protein
VSEYRWDLAERQVINAMCLGWSEDGKVQADDMGVEMTIEQIKKLSRVLNGGSAPHDLRQAVARHVQDGVLSIKRLDGKRYYRLDYRNLNRKPPAEGDRDEIRRIQQRLDIQATLGLDTKREMAWLTFFARLVAANHIRIESVPSFYNILIHNHPLFRDPADLKKLYDWMCGQAKAPRTMPGWKPLLTSYLQKQMAKSSQRAIFVRLREFRFRSRAADGEAVEFASAWRQVVSAVLICEVSHGRQDSYGWLYPRLALQRSGQLQPMEHTVNWNRKYQRIELDRYLKDLSATEPLAVVAALPSRSDTIRLKYLELRLGVYGKRRR